MLPVRALEPCERFVSMRRCLEAEARSGSEGRGSSRRTPPVSKRRLPVDDNRDGLGRQALRDSEEKTPPVRRHAEHIRRRRQLVAEIAHPRGQVEQRSRRAHVEARWRGHDGGTHQRGAVEREQFPAVGTPVRIGSARRSHLPPGTAGGNGPHSAIRSQPIGRQSDCREMWRDSAGSISVTRNCDRSRPAKIPAEFGHHTAAFNKSGENGAPSVTTFATGA